MKAEIIAVGSEMLTPFRLDTNSLFIARSLEEHGIRLSAKSVVGDEMDELIFALQTAFQRSDVIICSGGLGPTVDDITRESLAAYLGIPLELNSTVLEAIERRFALRGWRMPESNRKQAMVPAGAIVLDNRNGTAPGLYLQARGKQIFLLPGPPPELEPIWTQQVLPHLKPGPRLHRKIFRIAMIAESHLDEMLRPVTSALKDVQYTILAIPVAELEIHLTATEAAMDELISASAEIRAILGNKIYGEDFQPLEAVVGQLLKKSGKRVSVAESCTGGLLAERFTRIPGSSNYFESSVVTYSNEAKTDLLGVSAALIAKHGAVSEPVAREMAQNIRKMAGTDFGISITGIAGPDGGTPEKPVGTVFIGMASADQTIVNRLSLPGSRERVRMWATQAALNFLRLKLLE